MRSNRILLLLAVCLSPFFVSLASASYIDLSIQPSALVLADGETDRITISISGLGPYSAPSVSAFDLDVSFDPQILSLGNVIFGGPSGDQLDLSGAGSSTSSGISSPGTLRLFEVSFDSSATLDTLQPGGFVLATAEVTALQAGSSSIGLSVNTLADAYGNLLIATSTSGSSIEVIGPEPASSMTTVLGSVVLFAAFRRRRRCKQKIEIQL